LEKGKDRLYASISLPLALLEQIERLIEALGYWPSKTAFIREACLQMIEKYRRELETRRIVLAEAES